MAIAMAMLFGSAKAKFSYLVYPTLLWIVLLHGGKIYDLWKQKNRLA
jgi:hypothetical protein